MVFYTARKSAHVYYSIFYSPQVGLTTPGGAGTNLSALWTKSSVDALCIIRLIRQCVLHETRSDVLVIIAVEVHSTTAKFNICRTPV
jgi:hypothetical protein